MKFSRLFIAVAATTTFSCVALVGCQTHASTGADMVMRNGYVYTVDGKNSVQQAIAVTAGKIVYVGSDAGVSAYIGTQTQLIDLAGRMVMPGFVDAHMHPGDGGRAMTLCDLKYQTMTRKVFQETIQTCLDADKDKGPDVWLEVGSWDRIGMTGLDGDPDKSTLDALKTNRPIQVRSTDFHTVLTNSRGLTVAGINKHTANPGDGKYLRDSAGNPNGICEDGAAEAKAKALATTYDQGEAKPAPGVSMRYVKLFMDGIINAPADTGAMLTPYLRNAGSDTAPKWTPGQNTGELYFPPQVLNPLLLKAVQAGLDPHFHATGDRAVRDSLNGIEYVRQQLPGNGFRPAITHNESVDPADYARFKALDVTANMSFQWAQQASSTVDGTHEHLGATRFARMEPSGSIARAGGRVAYGSDWPVDPLDEFLALKIGVTRSGDPLNPHSYGPKYAGRLNADPALSRTEVLRTITLNAAEQLKLDAVVGSVEVGKFADLIVLDKNFMQVPEEELARNNVLLTLVGGQVVWAKAPFVGLDPKALSQASAARPVQ
ncbi:amidohydrolase [Pseudomonas sp. Ma2-10]